MNTGIIGSGIIGSGILWEYKFTTIRWSHINSRRLERLCVHWRFDTVRRFGRDDWAHQRNLRRTRNLLSGTLDAVPRFTGLRLMHEIVDAYRLRFG